MRVAIIDDESLIRDGLSNMLASLDGEDWNVAAVFRDAEEALETCDWDSIDLILADICMPGMSGLEMVEALRERGWDTPVIIISGYAQFDYARKAMQNSAVDFIVKPVDPDKLFSALRKARDLIAERNAEQTSRLFIRNNMERLAREFLGELLFETRALSEEHIKCLSSSFGLENKKYTVLVFLSDEGKDPEAMLSRYFGGAERNQLYCYSCGRGLYAAIVVGKNEADFDPSDFRSFAESSADIDGFVYCRADTVDGLSAGYAALLDQLRGSTAVKKPAPNLEAGKAAVLPEPASDYTLPVLRALAIIRQKYAKPLSLTIISDEVCVHPNYLSNLFKKQTGLALVDYINHFRVERAKELLEDPLNKIYWVTEQVGFMNQRYFSQVFKKITGVTPVEYRSSCYLSSERKES